MPTFEQLESLYQNNPQQYQAFMNSANALNDIFSSMNLYPRLGEPGTGPNAIAWTWGTNFGLVIDPPLNENSAVLESGLESIQESLNKPKEQLQPYLMGRLQPNGPTRYEIIKEYVRETKGQEAADAFDQHLINVNNVLQLGLDLDQIHAEANRGLQQPQEAPQEEVNLPQGQVQNNNLAAPAELKELDTVTPAQLLATEDMAVFMTQIDEAFGKMQNLEEKDPFYDLVSKARTLMGIGENIMSGGYQLPRDLDELGEYADNFLKEFRKVKQESPEAFNKFFGGALEQTWNNLDFNGAREKLQEWGYQEPVKNAPENKVPVNKAVGMVENEGPAIQDNIIDLDIQDQEDQEKLLAEEELAGKKSWNGYIREHSGDKVTDQNYQAYFAKVAVAKQAMNKGEKFNLDKARERAEKLMADPVFKKCMENVEEVKTMLKNRSAGDINRVIGNIGQPFAGTDKSMDTALEKLKFIGEAMDPSRKRSAEWKAMKQAFTNPPAHLNKAQQLQYAHECITKYMKGKKSLRSEGAERDRFDQSLDALAVLGEVTPWAKARCSKLVDRINYVRTHRPLAWQKNQPTISEEDLTNRAGSVDKYYNMKYGSTRQQSAGKNGAKNEPVGITASVYLLMGPSKENEAKLPKNDDVEFIIGSDLVVNICGGQRMVDSKKDFLATYLALGKVPAIRNQYEQVCVDKAQLENAVSEIKKAPDFDKFVETISDQEFKDLKETDDNYGKNVEKIEDAYQKFQNPEIGVNL